MAAKTGLKLIGFDKLKDILDPKKFEKRMKKHVGKATTRNGLIAEGKIKEAINRGKIRAASTGSTSGKRNADLTVAIKGSDRPLVDSGELVKSISSEVKSWDLAIIGVLRNRPIIDQRTGKKRSAMLIAMALHDGAEIKVTPKMRRFFFWMALHDDSPFKGTVKPLKASTKKIIIPPRPFMASALSTKLIDRYTSNWNKAMGKVMQGKN